MDANSTSEALETLRRLREQHEISILKLGEQMNCLGSRQRESDASNDPAEGPTPASLEADLEHYAELFAKLRFSYVEQVTKEKFIRAIVGDPPLIVTVQENLSLEKDNGEAKARLKSLKIEVADMVAELEKKGRELSRQYESLQRDTSLLEELPGKVEDLDKEVRELRAGQDCSGTTAHLHLPLTKTLGLVGRRKEEQLKLGRELEALQAKVPRKKKQRDRLRNEIQPLESKLQSSAAAAGEAQRRKEAALGGVADDLEQRARWWRAKESIVKQLLGEEGRGLESEPVLGA